MPIGLQGIPHPSMIPQLGYSQVINPLANFQGIPQQYVGSQIGVDSPIINQQFVAPQII